MNTNYHLENIETKSLIGEYTVHLCCYNIYKNEYILYLLELIKEQYYFPHFVSVNNVLEETKQHLNKLTLDGTIQGYYLVDSTCYVLIHLSIDTIIDNISPYIFGSIYEILFMRTCIGKKIDTSIVQLFIQHPYLLYLYDNNRKPIPELGYYITEKSSINYHTYIGLDPNDNGHIVIYNCEKLPEKPFIRVLSTLTNYNIKQPSNTKCRTIVIDKYMIVSHHKI